jgi:hypothetical protein
MITSIHIYVGRVHSHLPESFWDDVGKDLSEQYQCDLVIVSVDEENTRLSVDGDMTPDEMMNVKDSFGSHMQKTHS